MPKNWSVADIKPINWAVADIKPINQSIFDAKPMMSDRGAGLQGETTVSADRVLGAGQYMGLPFLLTYPTAGTITLWEGL